MKAVLISIKPKWCELIASGEKTMEVRKTKPKLETPFKVYIYETQGRTETPFVDEEGHHIFKGRGQVIGEFVCDKIVEFENDWFDGSFWETVEESCVDADSLARYIGNKDFGYDWHISNLVIYEEPRELNSFCRSGECSRCGWLEDGRCLKRDEQNCYNKHRVKRPPQSWAYVEELEGEK